MGRPVLTDFYTQTLGAAGLVFSCLEVSQISLVKQTDLNTTLEGDSVYLSRRLRNGKHTGL